MNIIPKRKKKSSQSNSCSTALLFSYQGLEEGRPEGLLASDPLFPIVKICQERKMPKLHRTISVLTYSAENESYPYLFPKQLTFLSEAPDLGLLMLSFPKVLLSFLRSRERDSSDYFYQFIFWSYKSYTHTYIPKHLHPSNIPERSTDAPSHLLRNT